jgi:hypothetical protein
VPEFAATYKMNVQQAYFYLKKYEGWDFLNEHWWVLHTDNPFYAVDYLYQICYKMEDNVNASLSRKLYQDLRKRLDRNI